LIASDGAWERKINFLIFYLDFLYLIFIMVVVLWSGKTVTLLFRVITFFELNVFNSNPGCFFLLTYFFLIFVSEITFIPSFHLQWTEDEQRPL
jgi:hypothetical protein